MHRPATITLRVSPLTAPLTSGLRRPGRRPAVAVTAVLVGTALALGACSTQSPAQTTVEYQPADGIDVNIGSVDARGLVLVSAAKGKPGVLVGSLINSGSDSVTVTFLTAEQAQASSSNGPSMQLKGNQQVPISGVQFDAVAAAPGDLTNIVLQTQAGQVLADVPVLLPDGYYATVTATQAANVSPPTVTLTGTPTDTVTLPVVTDTSGSTATTPVPPTSPATGG